MAIKENFFGHRSGCKAREDARYIAVYQMYMMRDLFNNWCVYVGLAITQKHWESKASKLGTYKRWKNNRITLLFAKYP